jgi:short-subunit dehydrogenase
MVKTFEVNLFAHFWIIREFLPAMIKQGRGHIVTTASLSSFLPCRDIAAYAASKHGVHGFIESLKQEIRLMPTQPKINFTTVYPIFVQTRLLDGITLKPT